MEACLATGTHYVDTANYEPEDTAKFEYKWQWAYREKFEKAGITVWECRNCGHIVIGTKAPEVCPVCFHPQSFFEVSAENY